MEREAVWQAIDAHRIRLADELVDLSADEWRQPSLCPGWTVRDVGAHLTMQQTGLGQFGPMLVELARARGNLDRAIRDSARRRADRPATEIIASIRGMVGSQRHNLGVTYQETLIDILVHSQDITVPLGRRLDLDPAAAAQAAHRVWTTRYFKAPQRFEGFRLAATDVDFSVGHGQDVRAPMDVILLLLTGRMAALPRAEGEGVAALARQLSPQ